MSKTPPSSARFLDAIMKTEHIYPSAQVFVHAYNLLKNPNVNVSDLVGTIKTDPSLTTDVIRISNSAYYGGGIRVTNLQSAILKVGFGEIVRLVGLSLSRNLYMGDLYHYGLPAKNAWRLSVASALLVEAVGSRVGVFPDDGYTLGLLHAIGKIFINQTMDDLGVDACYDGTVRVQEWEKSITGLDFAYAGSAVLRKWNFPVDLCDAVLYQLEPVVVNDASPLLSTLTFCLQFFHQIDVPEGTELEPITDPIGFLNYHRIHEDSIRNWVLRARDSFNKLVSAYDDIPQK